MASSVSSERAFSSARITISKRRNRLKGDIVEVLQVLKVNYHQNLIFREAPISSKLETEMDGAEGVVDDDEHFSETVAMSDLFSWDQLLVDD